MWTATIYPFANFNGWTVELWKWISNINVHFLIRENAFWRTTLNNQQLVTPYGGIDLDQHWLRGWIVAWRLVTRTNVGLSSNVFCMCSEMTIFKLLHLTGATELTFKTCCNEFFTLRTRYLSSKLGCYPKIWNIAYDIKLLIALGYHGSEYPATFTLHYLQLA